MSRANLWTVLALTVLSSPVAAQKASQTGTVSQEIYRTTIALQYDRPVARGRELFGALVPWDGVWTPGANRATWIDFSDPVTVAGQPVEAGRYGIWFLPHESGEWEVVLVSDWDVHHLRYPAAAEVARFTIPTEEASHMEVLSFYFPEVGPADGTLRFHWGTTTLDLPIEVPYEGG